MIGCLIKVLVIILWNWSIWGTVDINFYYKVTLRLVHLLPYLPTEASKMSTSQSSVTREEKNYCILLS